MVRRCDGALFDDAERGLETDGMDLNRIISVLAYECIYQQLMLALNDAIDEMEG